MQVHGKILHCAACCSKLTTDEMMRHLQEPAKLRQLHFSALRESALCCSNWQRRNSAVYEMAYQDTPQQAYHLTLHCRMDRLTEARTSLRVMLNGMPRAGGGVCSGRLPDKCKKSLLSCWQLSRAIRDRPLQKETALDHECLGFRGKHCKRITVVCIA